MTMRCGRSRRFSVFTDWASGQSGGHTPTPTPTAAEVDSSETSLFGHWDTWVPGVSVAAIWLATLASALLSPDLVTGSRQEHFPLVEPWIG